MVELTGDSGNVYLIPKDDGTVIACAEVALIVSEPQYRANVDGFAKVRELSALRFTTGAKQLRELAKHMTEWADIADDLAERVQLREEAPAA